MDNAGTFRSHPRYPRITRREVPAFIPACAKRILDVGCNTGGFGEALKAERELEVWGIEPNPAAAAEARRFLDKVCVGIFTAELAIPDDYFDVIVFNDVLEHMVDPWSALRLAKMKLASGGCVVASLPNLRHIDNLLHIVREGDFEYEEQGIRDSTHLRFFTRKSAIRMFKDTGFLIEHVQGINPSWWTRSLLRRAAFRLSTKYLEETKYIQDAFVARPFSE